MIKVIVMGTRGFPGVQGGIEKHCEELYNRLARIKDLDITVFAISKYCDKNLKNWNNIDFRYINSVNSKSFEKLYYGFKCCFHIIANKPDLVHIQGLNCAIFIPLLKLFRLKVVYTQHSTDYSYPKWGKIAKIILKLSEKVALKADKIIAVSELINNQFRNYTDKSVVIYNGVNLEHTDISEKEQNFYLDRYGLQKGGYIFFAGRFTEEKSIEDLINVYCRLDSTKFKLVITGNTEHETAYSKMVQDLAGKSGRIILTGFIKGKELQILFSNAKLFVLPSKHEGFPIVLLEALSYGIEVLASDIEANLQIGLNENNYFKQGNVEDLKEKILYFLNSEIAEEEKLRRFEMLKKNYNWDEISLKTYKIYKQVLNINLHQ